jgi:hypothetical protein
MARVKRRRAKGPDREAVRPVSRRCSSLFANERRVAGKGPAESLAAELLCERAGSEAPR